MAMIEIKKENKMDRIEILKVMLMIGAIIPTLIAAYTLPGLDKFFKTAADTELIAAAEAMKNWFTMGLVVFSCSLKGIRFFAKSFPILIMVDIGFSILVALLGPEYLELRFYGHVLCDVIAIGGISQAINHYVMRLWEKEELQLVCNRINLFGSIGAIAGSSAAYIYNPFSVNELLWLNVIVSVAAGIFRSFTFYSVKKEVLIKENK